jgi:Protein of unknown function (DUF2569)
MDTKESIAIQVTPPGPRGVDGWLLVLCLIFVVVSPLTGFYHIFVYTIPNLASAHGFKSICLLSVYSVTFSSLEIYGLIAGLKLWLIKPGAVSFVKHYLWTFLIANIAYFAFWVILIHPKQLHSFAEMGWYHVAGPILPFTLWYVYLEHSKRVRATYVPG